MNSTKTAWHRRLHALVALLVSFALTSFVVCPLYAYADTAKTSQGAEKADKAAIDETHAEDPDEDKDAAGDKGEAASDTGDEDADDPSATVDKDAKDTTSKADKKHGALSEDDKKKADKKKKEAEKEKTDRKKDELDKKADTIASTLAGLAFKLENATEDLVELNQKIAKAEKNLKKAKKQLKKHKTMLAKSKKNVDQGAKAIYTDGGTRLMSVLLGATNFEDFASRMYLYEKITQEWLHVFEEHKKQAAVVKKESAKIAEEIDELEDMRITAQSIGDGIAENIAAQEKALAHLDKKMSKLVNKKTEKYLHSYSHAFSKANSAAREWYGGSDTASDSIEGSHPSIVKIAMQYLGVKYVWAGETPSGFDCSGLTMYCYNKIGISLPHSARMQYSCGTHVSKKALMPGDLVFFGQSVAGIHHVGIYIGDDKYLHAPNTGDVVKVSKFSARSDCVGATRPK